MARSLEAVGEIVGLPAGLDRGFTGHRHDPTGFIDMGGRVYDPMTASFLTPDPVVVDLTNRQALNPYSYVLNSPTNLTDPTGFSPAEYGDGGAWGWVGAAFASAVAFFAGGKDRGKPGPPGVESVWLETGDTPRSHDTVQRTPQADVRGVRRTQSSSATARSRDAGVVTVPHVELGMTRLSMHDFGAVSYDDIVRVGATVARDYVQEVNSRGRPSIMGIEFPPTDAAGMMADGTAQFFGNVATVHDRQASGLSRLWAGVQVVGSVWSGVAALRSVSTAASSARAATEALCFAAGTEVHTEEGLKPIEEVAVGDLVWAKDESSGEMALRRVVQTFATPEQQVLEVVLEGPEGLEETIRATGEHPFWTRERGWVSADDLGSDDEILSRDGSWLNVRRTAWLPLRETVYNFEVEGFHTYFVGEQGAWVHNTCVDTARDLASRLPSELKCWGQCKQFASALQEGLQELGVKGTHIEIQVGKGITPFSDALRRALAERGVGHAAVRVGDTVFDNLRPGGIPYQEFIDDLGGSAFFGTPFVKVIETIF